MTLDTEIVRRMYDVAGAAMGTGTGDEDWTGWQVRATTNGNDVIGTLDEFTFS